MSEPSNKRMSKAERRAQLLDTALDIVRDEGTDALTLARVAERAGVTKPVAYQHFETRAGLLVALYERMDEEPRARLIAALRETPPRLADMARVAGRAYMSCYTSLGPEWYAVSAALAGSEEMEASRRQLLDAYVHIYREALGPLSALPKRALQLRCVGIIGAAEAIAQEMLRGRVSEAVASETLSSLIVAWLSARRG
jgi:AcrR family transcriptional regulator